MLFKPKKKVWMVKMDQSGCYLPLDGTVTEIRGETVYVRRSILVDGKLDFIITGEEPGKLFTTEKDATRAAVKMSLASVQKHLNRVDELACGFHWCGTKV